MNEKIIEMVKVIDGHLMVFLKEEGGATQFSVDSVNSNDWKGKNTTIFWRNSIFWIKVDFPLWI